MTTGFLLGIAFVPAIVIASLIIARVASINEFDREQAEADAEQAESLRKSQEAAAARRRHRDSMRGNLQ